ncbi:MAG TPA: hypothetical protein VMR45_03405 [Patescibacteria group bacterium]|nr:hypothetical protein [Patescibacteria group bacterium]
MEYDEYTRGQHRQALPGQEAHVDLPLESRAAMVGWIGCVAAASGYAAEALNSSGMRVVCGLATVATLGTGALIASDAIEYVFARYISRSRR